MDGGQERLGEGERFEEGDRLAGERLSEGERVPKWQREMTGEGERPRIEEWCHMHEA